MMLTLQERMANSILIGKAIYSQLSNDSTITGYVDGRIFPMMIPENNSVQFPFIVYSRTAVSPLYTKDGNFEDICDVTVIVTDTDYLRSCNIANAVRDSLEWRRGTINTLLIDEIKLVSVNEATSDNVYIQTLNFRIRVK